MVPSYLPYLSLQRERMVVDLMRAIQLRTMIGLLREPDLIVDHELSVFVHEPISAITGKRELALKWAAILSPDLRIDTVRVREYYRVEASILGQPYHCGFMSQIESLPICMVALNRMIERTEKLLRPR